MRHQESGHHKENLIQFNPTLHSIALHKLIFLPIAILSPGQCYLWLLSLRNKGYG